MIYRSLKEIKKDKIIIYHHLGLGDSIICNGLLNYIQNKLWESQKNNIHFLHLPFNTLPENKKWIMGCQCDFCKNDTIISETEKHIHYLIQYRNGYYFPEKFISKSYSSDYNEYLVFKIVNNEYFLLKKVFHKNSISID